MRKHVINYKKLELVRVRAPESPLQAIEDLMIFDARCLDKATWHQLLRVLPDLRRIRKAWKAHFAEFGCLYCKRKKTVYAAGGLCHTCLSRITGRMRRCFRNIRADRNIPDEIASLSRRYDAAQRLFNGDAR